MFIQWTALYDEKRITAICNRMVESHKYVEGRCQTQEMLQYDSIHMKFKKKKKSNLLPLRNWEELGLG